MYACSMCLHQTWCGCVKLSLLLQLHISALLLLLIAIFALSVQSFEADSSSLLLQHLSQPDTLAEYIRAALLCGRVAVAAWLVNVAARQQQLGVVRATLQSLLTASR